MATRQIRVLMARMGVICLCPRAKARGAKSQGCVFSSYLQIGNSKGGCLGKERRQRLITG